MQARYELDFQWRGFELHPEIPVGGIDIGEMFPAAQVEAMNARLLEVAATMGLPFDPPRHAPSTKKALALSELARTQGKLDAFRGAAMDAHWREGRDIEDEAVLAELAESAGLDPEEALAFLKDARVPSILAQQRAEAHAFGVTGIPTWFMLPDGWNPEDGSPEGAPQAVKVVGCQPLELVERAAAMSGATRKS